MSQQEISEVVPGTMLVLKAFLGWMLILLCAVINGALREGFLVPQLGPAAALAVSGVLLVACILVVSVALVPWFGALDVSRCLWIGLFWLCLTLSFEFGFGVNQEGRVLNDAHR